jgi:hypothetical protein
MSRLIPPIPVGAAIVQEKPFGVITTFFRLQWQNLIDGAILTSNVAEVQLTTPQTAAIPTANAFITRTGALYRVTYYLRKTIADGVSSSLQMTLGWTDHGTAIVQTFTPLTTDTTAATQSDTRMMYCDGASGITYDIAYASNTPAKMAYNAYVTVEQMA